MLTTVAEYEELDFSNYRVPASLSMHTNNSYGKEILMNS